MKGGSFYKGGIRGGDPTDDYPPHKKPPQRSQIIRRRGFLLGGELCQTLFRSHTRPVVASRTSSCAIRYIHRRPSPSPTGDTCTVPACLVPEPPHFHVEGWHCALSCSRDEPASALVRRRLSRLTPRRRCRQLGGAPFYACGQAREPRSPRSSCWGRRCRRRCPMVGRYALLGLQNSLHS